MSTDMAKINALIENTRSKMKITKVVATRAVKTKSGDFFCGMSAAWDSVQDDAGGQGSDLEVSIEDREVAVSGMTLEQARVAQTLLSLEASMGALRAALTDGALSMNEYEARIRGAKKNTLAHLSRMLPADEAKKQIEAVESK
jgi:hypothetical protein